MVSRLRQFPLGDELARGGACHAFANLFLASQESCRIKTGCFELFVFDVFDVCFFRGKDGNRGLRDAEPPALRSPLYWALSLPLCGNTTITRFSFFTFGWSELKQTGFTLFLSCRLVLRFRYNQARTTLHNQWLEEGSPVESAEETSIEPEVGTSAVFSWGIGKRCPRAPEPCTTRPIVRTSAG